ncbi:DUF5724 domain-containing protein [Parabacteroides sp.]
MNLYWRKESNEFVSDYADKIVSNKNRLVESERALFDLLIKRMTTGSYEADIYFQGLINNDEFYHINQLFGGSRYAVLQHILGDECAVKYVAWLDKMALIPYTSGYYRRPVRSANAYLLLGKALDDLKDFLAIVASGLPFETILEGGRTEEERKFISDIGFHQLMSVEIDAGNTAVIEKVKDIICSDNNAGRISYSLLQGIVMSNNRELYELEGKLLLAARLQEGLRQSICETMDSGTADAFIYLFNLIRTNDLQRYSSVKRAVGVWTGLVNEANADRINQKLMDLIGMVLTDPAYVESCLKSEDSIEVYLALWAKGFFKLTNLYTCADIIMKEGVKHKIQVLFYYLVATQDDQLRETFSKQALEQYSDDLSVVAAFLGSYMHSVSMGYYSSRKEDRSYFESLAEAKRHYEILKDIYRRVPKKQEYSPFIFPWHAAELSRQDLTKKMAAIVYVIGSDELLDDLCTCYDQMDSNVRHCVVKELLKVPSSSVQVDTLIKALGDRAEYPRKAAFDVLDKMELSDEQYIRIEELLKYKSGELRQQAISLLLKQKKEALSDSIGRLLSASVSEKRLGGLDILLTIRKQKEYADVYKEAVALVGRIKSPTSKEQLLIDQLIEGHSLSEAYTRENGFGLYDPRSTVAIPDLKTDDGFDIKKAFPILQEGSFLKKLFGKKQQDVYEILKKLADLIAQNAGYEYKTRYGYTVLLENSFWEIEGSTNDMPEIDRYPLAEIWRKFYKEEIGDFGTLLQICFFINTNWDDRTYSGCSSEVSKFYSPTIRSFYGFDLADRKRQASRLDYQNTILQIISMLSRAYWDNGYAGNLVRNILVSFCGVLNRDNMSCIYEYESYNKRKERNYTFIFQDSRIAFWMNELFDWRSEEEFASCFTLRYKFYQMADYYTTDPVSARHDNRLSILDFAKAYETGLIPEEEVMKELTLRYSSEEALGFASRFFSGSLTHWQKQKARKYETVDFTKFKELLSKVTARILDIELKRGDTPTDVSHLALKLEYVEGATYLVQILKAFGKDTFERTDYYYNSSYTKKEVLSKLLRCCYPAPEDNAEVLSALLKGSGITEKRLVEAAMYAPQWLDIIEQSLAWKGLTSAAYYFHAHINEWCDEKKKALIARYTPIEPEDLQLGAFDIDWFREAYKEIGAERFEIVYDAAKYISSSNGHTRARKYADAVNGKMVAAEVKKQIAGKRNKDLLMAYALIPLAKDTTSDLLERYQYLQQFLKESKAFGAQRQESEKKAVGIGMQNLARNAGYSDVTRLVWSMETELIKEMEPYFTPTELEGFTLYVEVDAEGKSELRYLKGEKALNNVPAKLKRHPYIEELKAVHKKLKNQYSRSRLMLEQAMEDGVPFFISELVVLTRNPVIWPLLRNLVFVSKDDTGFFNDNCLVTPDGECIAQKPDTPVRIAHPVDLYQRGVWHRYQQCLFEKAVRQPFKQVFRELYVKTGEERAMTNSLRYAGNQIQPQKTVALLKGRRWVANYEEGLQKIYYKENIIASIYALADWFSPAEIEAPTLEWVAFYERKTYKPLKIEDIPEIIFSEVMRDVDLAVSVAHAGGVDPEASHSTIEMRRAIIEFTLPLFKLSNVTLEGSHAFIRGTMGEYNIHLGSGVIHQKAGAAINVLPVHSQHRGRLFLPFVDEDPKTAEIVSKILLFAEDKKIKDPFILDQIKMK